MLHLRDLFFPNEHASIAPAEPLCVIGDIHGRLDLLKALLEKIGSDRKLVFVGDYIDRGPNSAQVIDTLIGLQTQGRARCLMGNHETMFLGFVDAPERGGGWLRAGGTETLASYGVHGVSEWADLDARKAAHKSLLANMPLDHMAFLFSLKPGHLSGNVLVSHAGADPTRKIDDQSWDTLVWGRNSVSDMCRQDSSWVVHGHTTKTEPIAADGHICVDTGAWKSGHLTAALIDPEKIRFIST